MAIVKCKECGKDVSNKAKVCPNCGIKLPQKISKIAVAILAVFVFFIILSSTAKKTSPSGSAQLSESSDSVENKQRDARLYAISAAETVLKENLREPESLVWVTKAYNISNNTICFDYRAKNGFGGYSREKLVINDKQVYRNNIKKYKELCSESDVLEKY